MSDKQSRPINLKPWEARAFALGNKTRITRVVKNPEHFGCLTGDCPHDLEHQCDEWMSKHCPLGQPGDELWGRETWAYFGGDEYLYQQIRDNVAYRSDDLGFDDPVGGRWRPSIQMPRWASRFAFTIKAVRFERVQDISEADAIAEGVEPNWIGDLNPPGGMAWDAKEHGWNPYDGDESQEGFPAVTAKDSFQGLFDMLNGPGSWDSNPWVWVYHVERIGE